MAFAWTTIGISLALVGMLFSVFIGTYGVRKSINLLIVLAISGFVVPLLPTILLWNLTPFVVIFDWPSGAIFLGPDAAIFGGSFLGSSLGFKAGVIWADDIDRSCFQCTLVPIFPLLITSAVFLFFM
ncbi:MAG: hypothetical protein ACFFED_14285 [Candidatus Thorarchaeota archaeon]